MKAHLLSPNGALKTGWALTRKHFIVMLGLFLGIMVLSWIVSLILLWIASLLGGTEPSSIYYWIIYIVNAIVPIWLGAGMNKIMLNAYAGEEPSFSTFGLVLPKLGGLIGLNVLLGVCMLPMVWGFVISVAGLNTNIGDSNLFIGITGIVFIICCLLSVYFTLRLMFAVYAYVDDFSVGVFGAIQRSWSMTHGNMGKIILCFLMMIVLNLIGLAVLIVGILVTLIISAFMIVAMYEQIKASEQPAAESVAEAVRPADEQPEQPGEPGSAE